MWGGDVGVTIHVGVLGFVVDVGVGLLVGKLGVGCVGRGCGCVIDNGEGGGGECWVVGVGVGLILGMVGVGRVDWGV